MNHPHNQAALEEQRQHKGTHVRGTPDEMFDYYESMHAALDVQVSGKSLGVEVPQECEERRAEHRRKSIDAATTSDALSAATTSVATPSSAQPDHSSKRTQGKNLRVGKSCQWHLYTVTVQTLHSHRTMVRTQPEIPAPRVRSPAEYIEHDGAGTPVGCPERTGCTILASAIRRLADESLNPRDAAGIHTYAHSDTHAHGNVHARRHMQARTQPRTQVRLHTRTSQQQHKQRSPGNPALSFP